MNPKITNMKLLLHSIFFSAFLLATATKVKSQNCVTNIYKDETAPTVTIANTAPAVASFENGGITTSGKYIKYSGFAGAYAEPALAFPAAIDVSNVVAGDKLVLSVDFANPINSNNNLTIIMNYNGAPLSVTGVNNMPGFQTIEVPITPTQITAWGGSIASIVFLSASGYTTGSVVSIDEIRIIKAATSLGISSASFTAAASASNTVALTNPPCDWVATSNSPWITITSGAIGNGNGTITYDVLANPGVNRSGIITIAGKDFVVTQAGSTPCLAIDLYKDETGPNVTVGNSAPAVASIENGGSTTAGKYLKFNGFNGTSYAEPVVNFNGGINISNAMAGDKLVISIDYLNPVNSNNNVSLIMNYSGNPMAVTGVDNIPGYQTFEIPITAAQKAGWGTSITSIVLLSANGYTAGTILSVDNVKIIGAATSISSSMVSLPATASTGNNVMLTSGSCGWVATSNDPWITITAGSSGTGNGTITFAVDPNSGISRTGTITIAGTTFTVNQLGAPVCVAAVLYQDEMAPAVTLFNTAPAIGSFENGGTTPTGKFIKFSNFDGLNYAEPSVNFTGGINVANASVGDKFIISVDYVNPVNASNDFTLTMNFAGSPFTISGVDNVPGFQTFELTITAAQKAAMGNTINSMTVVSATYFTGASVLSIDEIRIVKAPTALSMQSVSLPGTASTANQVMLTSGVCGWTAVSNNPWITITSGASGVGDGTITFDVQGNTITPRVGTITIAGNTFIVNQAAGIVPVTWLSFTAKLANKEETLLNWNVDNEVNVKEYVIEQSLDGANFKSIAVMPFVSVGLNINSYYFNDNISNVNAAVIYYRIKQIDNDGRNSRSNIARVNLNGLKKVISITPNPAKDFINVSLQSKAISLATVAIIDIKGAVLFTKTIQINKGLNNINFTEISKLQNGMYILRIINEQEIYNEKILVNR